MDKGEATPIKVWDSKFNYFLKIHAEQTFWLLLWVYDHHQKINISHNMFKKMTISATLDLNVFVGATEGTCD
jgi:hypothetical protein